jgi:hypothetical protein
LTPYIRGHLAPALQDLEDLYAELPSLITDEGDQRRFWEETRPEYIRRVREAMNHIGAALTAVGCTDEDLEDPKPEVVDDAEEAEEADSEVSEDEGDETVLLPLPDIQHEVTQEV